MSYSLWVRESKAAEPGPSKNTLSYHGVGNVYLKTKTFENKEETASGTQ